MEKPKPSEKDRSLSAGTENPNRVDHLKHPLALIIRALLLREERKVLKQMIIDDEENILAAIKAQIKLTKIFSTDRENLSKEFCQQLPNAIPMIDLSIRTAKKIFGNEKISRIFAIADVPKQPPIEFLKTSEKDFIVLDKLTISGNIGAIIRTAAALNVGAIVLLDSDPVDTYDRRVIRASRGNIFKIPILNINTVDLIQFCHKNKIKMVATTSHAETPIDEVMQNKNKLAIIFGNEKEGCSKELFEAADIKATIPIISEVESLNVSAAASIILYLRNLYHKAKS